MAPTRSLLLVYNERLFSAGADGVVHEMSLPEPFDGVEKVLLWSHAEYPLALTSLAGEVAGFAWWTEGALCGKVVDEWVHVDVMVGDEVAFVLSQRQSFLLRALDLRRNVDLWRVGFDESVCGCGGLEVCALANSVVVAGCSGRWRAHCSRTGAIINEGDGGWSGDVVSMHSARTGSWIAVSVAGVAGSFLVDVSSGRTSRVA
jgi:hypothetical protein